MKFIYTIFLLVITAVYILPVKDFIKDSPGISITDFAEEKEEGNNKEKLKEFISFAPIEISIWLNTFSTLVPSSLNLPAFFHTIETPPPDNNG
jgi:hypothetical protein